MVLVGRVWGSGCKRALLGLWVGAAALSACAAGEPIQAGAKAQASQPAAAATLKTSAGKGQPAGPAVAAWPQLSDAEWSACGREMRLFRGQVQALRDADLREPCKGGGQETETEAVAIPDGFAQLRPAPARLATAQDLPEEAFSPVGAVPVAKGAPVPAATPAVAVQAAPLPEPVPAPVAAPAPAPASAAAPAPAPAPLAVPPAAPGAPAAQPLAAEAPPPPMTGLQCQAEILKIHRDARAAVQAVPNPVAVRAVNGEMARRQKLLFATRCAQQPDAIEYVAAADRLLAANAAQAAAPVAPGGLLGAGAPAGEVAVGAMVATSAAPANDCLRLLETGLYGGFINKCAYKVNVAYCVSNPKKGGWTDTDAFRCLSPTNTKPSNAYLSLAASKTEVQHTLGGDAVPWLACKDPAVPFQTRFDAGRMLGTCKDR